MFTSSASFAAKCAQMTERTKQIDKDLDQALLELKLVVADTLNKLTRVEKLNIIKKVAA